MVSTHQQDSRPRSLREASLLASSGAGYASAMKEFTDWLCRNAAAPETPHGCYGIDPSCYADEPLWLEDAAERAHIAGMAEFLSSLAFSPPPQWSEGPAYFLEAPAFAGGRRSRDHLMAETPAAFRRRLLFCGPVLQRFFRAKPRPASAES